MMTVTSVYGVIDGLFISNFVGKTPFAAIKEPDGCKKCSRRAINYLIIILSAFTNNDFCRDVSAAYHAFELFLADNFYAELLRLIKLRARRLPRYYEGGFPCYGRLALSALTFYYLLRFTALKRG